jgi:transcriptional regulatory protein LEU3
MNQPGPDPVESSIHVPPTRNTSALLSSAWTAREYNGRHASQKRRACNECRQQKLRCDLGEGTGAPIIRCSRCVKLNLDCKVDETFQRTRKRKRSQDFEEEIKSLKKQLEQYQHSAPFSQSPDQNSGPGDETPDRSAPGRLSGSPAAHRASIGHTQRTPSLVNNGLLPPAETAILSPTTDRSELVGNTTRPHEHELEAPPEVAKAPISRPRSLGQGAVVLDETEIEKLYNVYLEYYHACLPILDLEIPAQRYAEASPLLFWVIMSVASRRSKTDPTLLSRLSQPVTDLLWKAVRSVPHSMALVQSILLLCTWPFPTSSSATDPSYVLIHTAISASIQIGLHRPQHPQDFAKYRVRLTDKDVATRITVWTVCNITAQR